MRQCLQDYVCSEQLDFVFKLLMIVVYPCRNMYKMFCLSRYGILFVCLDVLMNAFRGKIFGFEGLVCKIAGYTLYTGCLHGMRHIFCLLFQINIDSKSFQGKPK